MESENDLAQLKAYGEEMGLHGALTLKSLIDSHRHLRSLNLERSVEWQQEVKKGYEAGYANGRAQAIEYDYLSRETLQAMTLGQLAEILVERDGA